MGDEIKEEKEVKVLRTRAEHPMTSDKFTEEERKAYKEFVERVKGDGLTCKELQEGKWVLDEPMYLRFLIARNFNVNKATEMLKNHMLWRDENMPMSIGRKDLPSTFECGVFRIVGKSKMGINVNVSITKCFEPSEYSVEEYAKYIIYASERSLRTMGDKSTQHIWIFDLEGWGLMKHGGYKPTLMTKKLIQTAQDHYPERLAKALIINAPWLFSSFWKIIYPFIDEQTRVKVQFGPPSVLLDFIEPHLLPKEYGGTLDSIPLRSADELADLASTLTLADSAASLPTK